MNPLWISAPLMAVLFAAGTGIPMWLSIRHTDTGPLTAARLAPASDVSLERLCTEAEPCRRSTVSDPTGERCVGGCRPRNEPRRVVVRLRRAENSGGRCRGACQFGGPLVHTDLVVADPTDGPVGA